MNTINKLRKETKQIQRQLNEERKIIQKITDEMTGEVADEEAEKVFNETLRTVRTLQDTFNRIRRLKEIQDKELADTIVSLARETTDEMTREVADDALYQAKMNQKAKDLLKASQNLQKKKTEEIKTAEKLYTDKPKKWSPLVQKSARHALKLGDELTDRYYDLMEKHRKEKELYDEQFWQQTKEFFERQEAFEKMAEEREEKKEEVDAMLENLEDAYKRRVLEEEGARNVGIEKMEEYEDQMERQNLETKGATNLEEELRKQNTSIEERMEQRNRYFTGLMTQQGIQRQQRQRQQEEEEGRKQVSDAFRSQGGIPTFYRDMGRQWRARSLAREARTEDERPYVNKRQRTGEGIVRGRGLYFPAGENHYIDMNKLDKGFINLKNNKFKQVGKMEVAGGTLCSAVKSVLKGQNPRAEDVEELNDRERGYLNKLAKITGEGNFHVPVKNLSEEEKEKHQFDVMKGEIIAGNDNEKLVKDFKRLLLKLMSKHKINKKEGHDILMELVILGY